MAAPNLITRKTVLINAIIKLMREEKAKLDDSEESLISFANKLGTAIHNYSNDVAPVDETDIEYATVSFVETMLKIVSSNNNDKEDKVNKGKPEGYTPLDNNSKVDAIYLNIINNLIDGGETSLLSAEQGKLLAEQLGLKLNQGTYMGDAGDLKYEIDNHDHEIGNVTLLFENQLQ